MKKETQSNVVTLMVLILSGTAMLNLYFEVPLWVLMFVVILGLFVFIYVILKSKGQED